ncbi:MAG: hypothetical protein K8S87_09020 [Planctomycetes bacterium]|nr:hypothetical protein [Planctomycetota bacterium]
MLKYLAIFGFLVLFILTFSGCGKDAPVKTLPDKSTEKDKTDDDNSDDNNTTEKVEKIEVDNVEVPEKTEEIKLLVKHEDLVKAIGEPGIFKIMYYHLGICITCQEIIAKFEMLKAQFAEDFEFHHYLSHELESVGVKLKEFGIDSMTPSTGYLFDAKNKIIWKMSDPEFADFIKAMKKAGFTKEIYEPVLPPDFYE